MDHIPCPHHRDSNQSHDLVNGHAQGEWIGGQTALERLAVDGRTFLFVLCEVKEEFQREENSSKTEEEFFLYLAQDE